jgi:hypothetical protein
MMNGVLVLVLAVCWINIWGVWQTNTAMLPAAVSGEKIKPPRPFKAESETAILGAADYHSVVDDNLFSPDRKGPMPETDKTEEDAEPVEDEVRISGEKVMLYGVVLFGGYKAALINNPENHPKGVQNRWVKEGDSIANLKIREIHPDQVILSDSEGQYRVMLYDPDKVRKTSTALKKSDSSQPKVVSVGEAPETPKASVSSKPGQAKNTPQTSGAAAHEEEYQLIETPFGTIKKKIN